MFYLLKMQEVPIAVFSHLATCKTAQQTTILLKTAAVATSRVEAAKIRYNLIGDFAEQCELLLLALYVIVHM